MEDQEQPSIGAGVPHPPGVATKEISVQHPSTGETHSVHLPADHDGSRVKIEFPDGFVAWTQGFDPAQVALVGARPMVPCAECGAPQVLTQTEFNCSACGAHNVIELRSGTDNAAGVSSEE